jgi:hypothetical protein
MSDADANRKVKPVLPNGVEAAEQWCELGAQTMALGTRNNDQVGLPLGGVD